MRRVKPNKIIPWGQLPVKFQILEISLNTLSLRGPPRAAPWELAEVTTSVHRQALLLTRAPTPFKLLAISFRDYRRGPDYYVPLQSHELLPSKVEVQRFAESGLTSPCLSKSFGVDRMRLRNLLLFLCLGAIVIGAVLAEAQAYQANAYPYSAVAVDASQFCTGGFNAVLHTCINSSNSIGSTGNTIWEAISAAIASPLNVSGVIDARAFQGAQIVKAGVGTTALYG